jgi:hypothetical protein
MRKDRGYSRRFIIAFVLLFAAFAGSGWGAAKSSGEEDMSFFSRLPDYFECTSGVGGWATELHLAGDGSFTGVFHDEDSGDTGDGYPSGTRYECRFSGKFTSVKKAGEYEYTMKAEGLRTEGKKGEEHITDGVRVVTSGPYGFEGDGNFIVYLPGRHTSDLPEEFLEWMRMPLGWESIPKTLPVFGLYNTAEKLGFYGSGRARD